jgi:cell division protein FtsW
LGQGYGKGLQKFGYIPEAQSDFIFSAFSEEIGFMGNLALLALYCWLFRYFLKKLQEVKDPQSKMI